MRGLAPNTFHFAGSAKLTLKYRTQKKRTAFFMLCAFSVFVTKSDEVPSCFKKLALAY
jgi:hypothetical protein